IVWSNRGAHSSRTCEIKLSPFEDDAAQTHVAIDCKGGSMADGAAAGMTHRLHRESQIERIDSTLTGRPFDRTRAGSTSARWPGDGVDGSYGTAVKTAIKMDHEMREMQAQSRDDSELVIQDYDPYAEQ
ncbi:MAG: hypothetical protein AAGL68_03225, partial [Pseudomonadota bacterium]